MGIKYSINFTSSSNPVSQDVCWVFSSMHFRKPSGIIHAEVAVSKSIGENYVVSFTSPEVMFKRSLRVRCTETRGARSSCEEGAYSRINAASLEGSNDVDRDRGKTAGSKSRLSTSPPLNHSESTFESCQRSRQVNPNSPSIHR